MNQRTQQPESRQKIASQLLAAQAVCLLLSAFCFCPTTCACPFCTAVKPTLVQQREAADAAFLGECLAVPPQRTAGKHEFAVLREFRGKFSAGTPAKHPVELNEPVKPGTLALVMSAGETDNPQQDRWRCIPLNEVGFAYVANAPDMRTAAPKRLEYFAKFLQHADPLVAEDAFLEFGHAPLDAVEQAAAVLSAAKLREWIVDPTVPAERKGFFGLALGLTAQSAERPANLALLEKLIVADTKPGDDFRAGFDGILGGYLVARGQAGIKLISQRCLASPKAAVGDVRHAHQALRFYYEFGPSEQRGEIVAAVESLLGRPSAAAAAITDLARWQDWTVLERVVALFDQMDFQEADVRRAIVGYLRACPLPAAAKSLNELRRREPKIVAAAEAELEALTGK